MPFLVLAVGDVTGEAGLAFLERHLRPLQRREGIAFTVVNGENAAGNGITPQQARRIYAAGADVVTLGNHAFKKDGIAALLEEAPWLLRPANLSPRLPGRGWVELDMNGVQVRTVNLIGRCGLEWNADNPFSAALAAAQRPGAAVILAEFHAQATSEKIALGRYLDGRVSALWGTHTHVPTADETVLPGGSGYITDIGMTGPVDAVLGVETAQSVEFFLGGLPGRYRNPAGPCRLQGAIFSVDTETGRCTQVRRIQVQPERE